jgi:radical SAM protein with 4Fe4S-binding SPASM domain
MRSARVKVGLDYGLFFKDPAGVGGTLRLVGWTSEDGAGEETLDFRPRFMVKHRGEPIGEFSCERSFDVLLPWRRAMEGTSEIEIDMSGPGSWRAMGRFTITSADVVFDRDIGPARLTPRQKHKLRNLFSNEHERLHGVRRLQSHPIYLLIDPSFSCQLHCPSCHADMLREQGFSMRHLRPEVLQRLMDAYGETLIMVYFANWGEPLLNPRFDTLVAVMKRYDIWVTTSTNLSLPLSDARVDGLVRSGLDHMILSIDGTTQTSYEQYRRGGDLSLVLDNVRRLVATKRRLQRPTPRLRWQFLVFPWNRHEVGEAQRLANTIGCDEFDAHDGDIHPRVVIPQEARPPGMNHLPPDHRARLLQLRGEKIAQGKFFGCDHLYHQMAVNSDGSVHPCCYMVAPAHFVGRVGANETGDLFNHEILQDSRQLLGSAEAIQAGVGYDPCANCNIVTARGGHVESALNFLSGIELVTGRSLRTFLPASVAGRPPISVVARAVRHFLSRT